MWWNDKTLKLAFVVKKNLDSSKKEFQFNSKEIRIRYHRIMKDSYSNAMSSKIILDKPIFIIGVPHSGTSVLSSTFQTHPDVAQWTEAPEVWEPYWSEGVDSDYNRLVPKYETDVEEMDILRITNAFYRYVQSQHKKRLVNKNPRNTVRISFIKKIFPDAKIIHIYRDGRDVVNSITRNMPPFMIEQICDRWINSLDEVKKQSVNVASSDFYAIKYEELCEKPREILIEAYKKCELSVTDQIINKLPDKLTNFNGKWKTQMNEKYHELLRKKLETKMLEYGYQW